MGEFFHRDEIEGTLPARFATQVKRHGARLAVSDGHTRLTYDALAACAERIASAIRQAAGSGSEPVALLLEHDPSAVAGIVATLLAGRAYVPIDPSYPRATIEHMLADSGARLILGHAPTAALGSELALGEIQWLDIDIDIDIDRARAHTRDVPNAPPARELTPDSPACIIYTSGSTGKPKGIVHTQRTLLHHIWSHTRGCAITCEDRQALLVSYSFAASFSEIFGALLNGAHLCLHQVKRAGMADLAAWLRSERITIFKLPVSLFRIFLGALPAEEIFPSVRQVVLGGDALLAKDIVNARRHFPPTCSLMNRLTSSEALSQTRFVIDSTMELHDMVVPVGYPEDDKEVLILGEDLRPLALGETGEIAIRSAYLTPGYWRREDLDRASFLPARPGDPRRIYRTGDLGRMRSDGCLEHLGRGDRRVKVRGYRVELDAIEATLAAMDTVKEAAVVLRGRGEDAGSSQVVAYVVPAARPAPTIESLRAALAASLPDYMVPSAFVMVPALPMTATGKVDRAALPAPAAARPNLGIPWGQPRTEVEHFVAEIWAAALGLDRVGAHDNFFDLGGDSLMLLAVHARLRDRFAIDIPVVDMFRNPTVAALAATLAQRLVPGQVSGATARPVASPSAKSPDIAIVGLAGVFPGAIDVASFWSNLRQGVESIAILDNETLRRSGVENDLLANPRYVRRVPLLPEWKAFDAAFFGLAPLEAAILDPQHRMLLQVAWHALEHAGAAANPTGTDGERIGIFAGCCQSAYFLQHLLPRRAQLRGVSDLQLRMATDPEFLATRIAYKLDLRGPAINVQTACSTSLVAVHLACQSLAHGECEIALAGGASVETPEPAGYLHDEGWICSPDGHCRPFDARAQGTVIGSGAGMVVLKSLERAVADGDTIHAVIRGSAINNDGALKVGFAAPSAEGQMQVVAAALAAAGAAADDIDYVETHGTGTALGDPIEIAALTSAFRATSARTGDCPIGAVKANVGHLSRAAGIAGLIKTVLCLEHGEIPPSLHFEKPNPQIDFSRTPFVVNQALRSWPKRPSRESRPRMASVSSFGVGGTNAHAILEQAPAQPSRPSRLWQLLVLSARTETALATSARNLAHALNERPECELADVAFTLQAGRRAFEYRQFAVCRDRQDAVTRLSTATGGVRVAGSQPPSVVFLFPGQGAQDANMGRELYDEEPVFRAEVDRCAQALRVPLGIDLREVYFSPSDGDARHSETWLAQPALFVTQYALAKLWMHWGVRPSAMLGHSIGEHTAACLAGVMSFEDTLALIARRGKLLHAQPRGSMLVVHLDEQQAREYLTKEISLAAVNAPSLCVVAGREDAIRALMATFVARGIDHHLLPTSHAFHSAMMDPVLDDFTREVAALTLHQPSIPYVSGVTGDWLSQQDAVAPDYWSRLLRGTVRFSAGLRRLAEDPAAIFLEVGPGRSLITLARQHEELRDRILLPTLRSYGESRPDREVLLLTLGELWRQGVPIDWRAHHGDPRRKIPLPQYPFEPREQWIGRSHVARAVSLDEGDSDLHLDVDAEKKEPRQQQSPTESPAIDSLKAILCAPAGARTSLVLAWLRETLAVLSGTENSQELSAQASLEEAGIDSLAAIRLCASIEAELNIRIAVKAMLSAGNVSGLAALLSHTIGARKTD
jgi:amino acid adenylation domain-containing protein